MDVSDEDLEGLETMMQGRHDMEIYGFVFNLIIWNKVESSFPVLSSVQKGSKLHIEGVRKLSVWDDNVERFSGALFIHVPHRQSPTRL